MAESSKRRKNEFTIAEKAWLINYAGRNSSVCKNNLGKALADHINSLQKRQVAGKQQKTLLSLWGKK